MCLLSDVMLGQAPGLTPTHADTVFKVGRAHCDAWTLQQTLEMMRCLFSESRRHKAREPEAQSTRAWPGGHPARTPRTRLTFHGISAPWKPALAEGGLPLYSGFRQLSPTPNTEYDMRWGTKHVCECVCV